MQTMESEESQRMSGEGQSNIFRTLEIEVIIFLVLRSSTGFNNPTTQNHIISNYLGDLKDNFFKVHTHTQNQKPTTNKGQTIF